MTQLNGCIECPAAFKACADCAEAIWLDQNVYPVTPGEPADGVRCTVCEAKNRTANTPGAEL